MSKNPAVFVVVAGFLGLLVSLTSFLSTTVRPQEVNNLSYEWSWPYRLVEREKLTPVWQSKKTEGRMFARPGPPLTSHNLSWAQSNLSWSYGGFNSLVFSNIFFDSQAEPTIGSRPQDTSPRVLLSFLQVVS